MNGNSVKLLLSAILVGTFCLETLADGDETLGTPSVAIASGTGVIVAGTGMISQPGSLDFVVPAGATIQQVLLYWAGRGTPDDTIVIDATSVTGVEIGMSAPQANMSTAYRADITNEGLVAVGGNSLSVSGMVFGNRADGAAILVIIDDGSATLDFQIRDGLDFAFVGSPGDLQVTVAQTFNFASSTSNRVADVLIFLGDGTVDRPDEIEVSVGGNPPTVLCNEARGRDGDEWDTIVHPVNVPAGATSVTVQLFSRDCAGGAPSGTPDSLSWVVGGLVLRSPPGGGEGCTPGFWKNHLGDWPNPPYAPGTLFSDVFEDAFPGKTLEDVVRLGGGGLRALGRHTVAALLNAESSGVNFGLTVGEVIDMFNDVFPGSNREYNDLKNQLVELNELGCSVGRSSKG